MSEEFEDISVDVSIDASIGMGVDVAPVSGGTEAPVVPIEASNPMSEQPDADQRVFDNNPKIGTSEDNIRQDIAAENGMALSNGGDEGRAPVTERGKEEAENKKQEAREVLLDQMERAQKDFLNKDHEFAGMKMSGQDLDKLITFYSANPAMLEKLQSSLSKNNDPEKVKKGVKEFQEFLDLKKKEQDGKLDADGQRRLEELKKSEEFKLVAQAAVQQAKDNGVVLVVNKSIEAQNSRMNGDDVSANQSIQQLLKQDVTTEEKKLEKSKSIEGFGGMEMARAQLASTTMAASDDFDTKASAQNQLVKGLKSGFGSSDAEASRTKFASAPRLTSEFSTTVAAIEPAPAPSAANDPSFKSDTAPVNAIVAQAQVPKKMVTADVSFG